VLDPAFRRHRFRVAPDSAGADRRPACYRRVGPLTVSDANVCVGASSTGAFPATFGPAADQPHAEVVIANSPTLRTRSLGTGEAEGTRTVAEGSCLS
jgi:5-oxoprolinase (ATP-hydrolysing)